MDIRNCNFKYKCPKSWSTLIATSEDNVRYCDHCDRGVHYCRDKNELMTAMENDWCVAIPIDPLKITDPQTDQNPFELNMDTTSAKTEIDPLADLPLGFEPGDDVVMGDIEWTDPEEDLNIPIATETSDKKPLTTPPLLDDFLPKK